jgi:hypothetical protein
MAAVREHFKHHGNHMLGCLLAFAVLIAGAVLAIPALAIIGGVACAVMCGSMVWMMVRAGQSP